MSNIAKIEKFVIKQMDAEIAHGFQHVNRVRNWALKLAKAEKFENIEQVEAAALLHDIGRATTKKGQNHGIIGAAIARKFLEKHKIFDIQEREEVILAVASHSTPGQGREELTAILKDADMLDALGAMGIVRPFTHFAGNQEYDENDVKGKGFCKSMDFFQEMLDLGEPMAEPIVNQVNFQIAFFENLKTESAKKIAKPMIKYMQDFLRQLEKEVKQK